MIRKKPSLEQMKNQVEEIKSKLDMFYQNYAPRYQEIIDKRAKQGWRYIGYIPTKQRGTGHIQELDLIFEKIDK